jgi:hypothetical protein
MGKIICFDLGSDYDILQYLMSQGGGMEGKEDAFRS